MIETLDYSDGTKAFFLKESLTNELMRSLAHAGVNKLVVRNYQDWDVKDISSLNNHIKKLFIEDENTPASLISQLVGIEELSLRKPCKNIDFSIFHNLEICYLSDVKKIPKGLEKCQNLNTLKLANSKLKEFEDLKKYHYLEDLELNNVKVNSLAPINHLPRLKLLTVIRSQDSDLSFIKECVELRELHLSIFPKLESLSGLRHLENLQVLNLESCPKLENLELAESLPNLRVFALVNCPNISSLKPLLTLSGLKKILLWEKTKIGDGNLRCLLSLPNLERLSFLNRRHYNLKIDEAKSVLAP